MAQEDSDEVMARKIGISAEEYRSIRNTGKGWCAFHRKWHPSGMFNPTVKGGRKLQSRCRASYTKRQVSTPYSTKQPDQAARFKPWGGRALTHEDEFDSS